AAYGGLRAFLARQDGIRLTLSAIAFGIARPGMHYTAMYGMHFVPRSEAAHHQLAGGLAASPQIVSVVVAVLCFVIAAGFLLSLVPDPRRQTGAAPPTVDPLAPASVAAAPREAAAVPFPRLMAAPLGGLVQPPRAAPVPRLPVEGADGT